MMLVRTAGVKPVLLDDERVQEVLELLCADDAGAFDRWIAQLDTDLVKFRALLASAGNPDGKRDIHIAAHALKGACLVIGAQALATLFAELEASAKAGDLTEVNRHYAAGRELEAETLAALKAASAK